MAAVYIFGAGASFGDRLKVRDDPPPPFDVTPTPPPLVDGFFTQKLYADLKYQGDTAQSDFPRVFEYIQRTWLVSDRIGEGAWQTLDLEKVFTSIELEREFLNPDSDHAAQMLIVRNELLRYIRKIISFCMRYSYGEYTRRLVTSLDGDDSLITFNWDLLSDQEFRPHDRGSKRWQYNNFLLRCLGQWVENSTSPMVVGGDAGKLGMFLKMHGSLSWHQCTNVKCPANVGIDLDVEIQLAADRALLGQPFCSRCGSDTSPLLIPPLLRKPITDNSIIRSVWGMARQRLSSASKVVLIGFSAAPTDFYASWLIRSTVGIRNRVEVIVVNPANAPFHSAHNEFANRMSSLFPRGYDDKFCSFEEFCASI